MAMEIAMMMVFVSVLEILLVVRVSSALPVISQAIAANVCTSYTFQLFPTVSITELVFFFFCFLRL